MLLTELEADAGSSVEAKLAAPREFLIARRVLIGPPATSSPSRGAVTGPLPPVVANRRPAVVAGTAKNISWLVTSGEFRDHQDNRVI